MAESRECDEDGARRRRTETLERQPGQLVPAVEASVEVTMESEDDGAHGIWFNRGVAGSQAFIKRFGQYTPPVGASEDHPAFGWLSRGLGEAFLALVARAGDDRWGIRGPPPTTRPAAGANASDAHSPAQRFNRQRRPNLPRCEPSSISP